MGEPATRRDGQSPGARWQRWLLLVLPAAALLLLWPVLLAGQALLPGEFLLHFEPWQTEVGPGSGHWNALSWDALAQYYPWRAYGSRALGAGHLPLWNPHQFCGAPFLANAQSALLYPPNLLFLVMPASRAFGWLALLHLVLAGSGTYLFLRELGRSRSGALLGGLAFMLCGFFVTWLEMTTVLASGAWLPLAWWCTARYFHRAQGRWAVGLGLTLAAAVLAGHPQMAFYVFLGAGLYYLYQGACFVREGGRRRLLVAGAGGLGALAVAGLLAAGQVLPTIEYLQHSHRTPGGYGAYVRYALAWQQAMGAVLPDFFGRPSLGNYWGRGNYAEFVSYVGVVPLLLGGAAAWCGRRQHFWFLAALAGFALLAALGTPVNKLFYYAVPGFKGSGGPARMLYLWALALGGLAAFGHDGLRERLAQGGARRGPALLALGLLAVAGVGSLAVWKLTPSLAGLGLPTVMQWAAGNWVVLVVGATAFLSVVRLARWRLRLLAPGLAALVAADLLLFAHGYNPTASPEIVYPPTRITSALAQPGAGRTLGLYVRWPLDSFPQAALPPNWAMVYGAEDVLGYDSIYPARYKALLTAAQGGDPSPQANGNMLLAGRFDRALAQRLDVGWVVVPEAVAAPEGWAVVARMPSLTVLASQAGRSRAWWTPQPATASSLGRAVAALRREPLVPVLEGAADRAGRPAVPLATRWSRTSPGRMRLECQVPAAGWLVVAEGWFPGWRARVNGQVAPVRPVDLALRGIRVPAGRVVVQMSYEPQAVRLGLFLSCLGLALALGGAGWLAAGRVRDGRQG